MNAKKYFWELHYSEKNWSIWNENPELVYLFAVFWIGEVYEIIIVHLLGIDDVTVFFLTEILWVNSIGS